MRKVLLTTLLLSTSATAALAQTATAVTPSNAPPNSVSSLSPPADSVTVYGTTPLLGKGIDPDLVPGETQSYSATQLGRNTPSGISGALNDRVGSVNVDDTNGNPFQPDFEFRGFDASPLDGNAQGLAVYQNGVRINEVFGDTVNFDLIPEIAINRTTLSSSNPLFGLNALGGALSLEMKDGFNTQGGTAETEFGSFGRREGSIEYGQQVGQYGLYVAGSKIADDGWRQDSPSDLSQLYGDLGIRSQHGRVDVNIEGADTNTSGNGSTPESVLAQNYSGIFTGPAYTKNQLGLLSTNGSIDLNDTLSVQGDAYVRALNQSTQNGNTTDAQSCTSGNGLLCLNGNGETIIDKNGNPIPDISNGGQYVLGEDDSSRTHEVSTGVAAQATEKRQLWDHDNQFIFGASYDHGHAGYSSEPQLGTIPPSGIIIASPYIIDEPDGVIAPVRVTTDNDYYGIFLTDTFNITPQWAVTGSGRENIEQIDLHDDIGTSLNGNHSYDRFNPALGTTYKITRNVTGYFGYAEANRAPTPAELSCANALEPCTLANTLVSDPNLKQVVTGTFETGLRGQFKALENDAAKVKWNLGLFRTDSDDDIIYVASPTLIGRGNFQNIPQTRRQGIESGISFETEDYSLFANYSYIDATYESNLSLLSNSPFADPVTGTVSVKPGDNIPGIPQHRIKLGAQYNLTDNWLVGGTINITSGQYLQGDDGNQDQQLKPYGTLNLNTSYQVTKHIELFGILRNVLDRHYNTYGAYSQLLDGTTTERFYSPAMPFAGYAGVRVTF